MLASRGLRETGSGTERIADDGLRRRLLVRARTIGMRAMVATLLVTAVALALPPRD